MELDRFIEETLVNISQGVSRANKTIREFESEKENYKLFMLEPGNDKTTGMGISFDVAITAQTDAQVQGGGKIKIAVFEANLKGGESSINKSISRVQFNVSIKKWHG